MHRRPLLSRVAAQLPLVVIVTAAIALVGCSSGGGAVAVQTVTPSPVSGGKAATPPTIAPQASPTGQATPGSSPAAATSTPSTGGQAGQGSAPTSGRWIDVDVTRLQVRLMNGAQVVETIGPVAVGTQVNTGAYESTQTGLFTVYNKIAGLQYDAPYNAYISDWVAFDPQKDNGFHSFLQDASGKVVDVSTGRVTNGCIRTGAARAIFDFAEAGMPVYVHL